MKAVPYILSLVWLGLVVGLYFQRQKAGQHIEAAAAEVLQMSNRWHEAQAKFEEQELKAAQSQTNHALAVRQLNTTSNRLAAAEVALAQAQAETKSAVAQTTHREAALAETKSAQDELAREKSELSGTIISLQGQITRLQKQLAGADNDRGILADQIQRLQAEKNELVQWFNDPAALQAQAARLKEASKRSPATTARGTLQLQPDGSVTFAPNPANATPKL